MARNEEKHQGRLNRLVLKTLREEEEKKNPKRPNLNSLNTADEIKRWLPSIKKDLDFYLKQSEVPCYPERVINEFSQRIRHLQGEYKAFLSKLKSLNPDFKVVPWTERAYDVKEKKRRGSQQKTGEDPVIKRDRTSQLTFEKFALPILTSKTEDAYESNQTTRVETPWNIIEAYDERETNEVSCLEPERNQHSKEIKWTDTENLQNKHSDEMKCTDTKDLQRCDKTKNDEHIGRLNDREMRGFAVGSDSMRDSSVTDCHVGMNDKPLLFNFNLMYDHQNRINSEELHVVAESYDDTNSEHSTKDGRLSEVKCKSDSSHVSINSSDKVNNINQSKSITPCDFKREKTACNSVCSGKEPVNGNILGIDYISSDEEDL